MRLKATPSDFVVREATDLRIRKTPLPYRVYMLEKEDWNTVDALTRIAKAARLPYDRFAYGGKKDRHAHTYQYVTVEAPRDLSLKEKGYSLTWLGYSDQPMGPSHILANHFTITARELSQADVDLLTARLGAIERHGLPNYFDDQRFGTFDKERGFIAEKMLQGRWEDALNIALTSIYSEENSDAKRRKRAIREAWGDWAACRALAQTAFERRSFDLLSERPGDFRAALGTVARETALMWISAYQSFLYNEVLTRLLAERGLQGPFTHGAVSPYRFFPEGQGLPLDLIIPLPGKGMRFPDEESGWLFESILRERRLRPASLETAPLPGIDIKASPRPAVVVPHGLHVDGPTEDERYPGKHKVILHFSLPRGSYATMIIKAMLAR